MGIDSSLKKQIAKRGLQENSFQAIAEIWLADKKPYWSNSNYIRTESYLRRDVYPLLGQRDIATIEVLEIIPVVTFGYLCKIPYRVTSKKKTKTMQKKKLVSLRIK